MIRQRRPAQHLQGLSPSEATEAIAEAAAAAVGQPTLSTPVPRTDKGRRAAKMNSNNNVDSRQDSSSSSSSPPALDERLPLLPNTNEEDGLSPKDDKMGWVRQNKWIVLAIASGACAAFNGVFAKLYVRTQSPRLTHLPAEALTISTFCRTTTELTTSFAQGVARVLHLDSAGNVIEYIVRAVSHHDSYPIPHRLRYPL